MNPDLDTLVTALYVTVDDLLVAHPEWVPPRPTVVIAPAQLGLDRHRGGTPAGVAVRIL